MSDIDERWNWDEVSESTVREIVRLAEVHLENLLQVAIAADQRAAVQAGILAGFGAGLLAAAATLATNDPPQVIAAISALVASVGLILASFISGLAAKPADYFANGYQPKQLLSSAKDELWMLKGIAQDMQIRIERNRLVIAQTARLTTRAYCVAFVGIILAAGVFIGASVA